MSFFVQMHPCLNPITITITHEQGSTTTLPLRSDARPNRLPPPEIGFVESKLTPIAKKYGIQPTMSP